MAISVTPTQIQLAIKYNGLARICGLNELIHCEMTILEKFDT